jgi:hypothetical protein
VLHHLLQAQQVVLAVDEAYIASAAQADASRTEPPFQLQGSYRNMNKLAERIVPAMNDGELAGRTALPLGRGRRPSQPEPAAEQYSERNRQCAQAIRGAFPAATPSQPGREGRRSHH